VGASAVKEKEEGVGLGKGVSFEERQIEIQTS
jgi:hypothetical protein